METFDWILFGGVAAGAGTIGTIVVRKFSVLSAIDLTAIPEERHRQTKEELLERRLIRKITAPFARIAQRVAPVAIFFQNAAQRAHGRLRTLERAYSAKVRAQAQRFPHPFPEHQRKLAALLIEARRHLNDGAPTEAEKRCIEAIALDHDSIDAYELLVELYGQQEDYAHAKEVALHLVRLAEKKTKRSKFGRSRAVTTLALTRKLPTYYLEACTVLYKTGEAVQAMEYCRKAVDAEPNNPKMLDQLIQVSVAAGAKACAQDALEKLERVNPENQKLPELRDLVQSLQKG